MTPLDQQPHHERPSDEDYAAFAWMTVVAVGFVFGVGLYQLFKWVAS